MFFELIRKRRSIRKYLPKPVEPDKIELLIEAALRAPSSRSSVPWEFIVVQRPDLMEKLAKAKQQGCAFLKNAPLAIVICADSARSDVWIEDASVATTFILLAAEALDLGSCWVQIRERLQSPETTAEAYVRNLLQIPDRLKVEAIVAAGYPDESKPPHRKEDLDYGKIFRNGYQKP